MIVFNALGAVISDYQSCSFTASALLLAAAAAAVGLYSVFAGKKSSNADRLISLLPSITKSTWAMLTVSLKLGRLDPRGT